jgi:hypothetical protein
LGPMHAPHHPPALCKPYKLALCVCLPKPFASQRSSCEPIHLSPPLSSRTKQVARLAAVSVSVCTIAGSSWAACPSLYPARTRESFLSDRAPASL